MAARRPTRRDFLRGKAAADALVDAIAIPSGDVLSAGLPDSGYGQLLRIGRRAMACEFEVLMPTGLPADATRAAVAALDLVDELEAQLTVFRESSEVSQLNKTAASQPVVIERRLFDLLARAMQMHRETGGAYDIATGALTKLWGFYKRAGRMPTDGELAETMKAVGMQHVELNSDEQSVRYLRLGLEINLGSIGKGYALDRAAELLSNSGATNFLIHGGNSSILARGSSADHDTLPESDGWWVGLRNPLKPQSRIGEIRLRNQAVGTSGGGTQFFMHAGHRYSHILDPRTGRPAEGTLSVTVVARSGADADALATAFYVMGCQRAIDYCRQHEEVSAVLVSPGAQGGTVNIVLCGIGDANIRFYPDQPVVVNRAEMQAVSPRP